MSNINCEYIVYDTKSNFQISPKMNCDMIHKLSKYISDLKKYYFEIHGENCFFWKLDQENSLIIIDEIIQNVNDDIFNQIYEIALWILSNNYYLVGDFCYVTENGIQYTIMNDNDKFITHYTCVNKIDRLDFNNMIKINRQLIIKQAKQQITQYISKTKKENNHSIIFNTFNYYLRPNNRNVISYRNKKYKQKSTSEFLLNIFAIIGIISTTAACIYIYYS
ncbi:hypothetical protein QKC54_gp0669 [Megavirus baoshan]|uniref:Uncharacterized protein n=1 Tax=Megavirus baoshan TaxID=2496520 RepID=A0A3S5HL81_9VIRU|nr:hypothetical protein QKC54_gp0669 [Megavirus baoshan]AZL89170.1 hypothetical protein Mb0403 [Megavirus baoshan]